MASPTFAEFRTSLVLPGYLLFWAVKSFVLVLVETVTQRNRSLSEVKDEAFSRFWRIINAPPPPGTPLAGSATLPPALLPTASGVVLELGPGSGEQVQHFATAKKATTIYGAEPCVPLHPDLQANAVRYGLRDKYRIVTAGAEKETLIPGLAKAGLLTDKSPRSGIFDTVVCVRVLCSVQDLRETTAAIYTLLKPGGKLIVVEHTVNPWNTPQGSYIARMMQTAYSLLGWTFFVGNCHLRRDIRQAIIDSASTDGGWGRVDLKTHFGWAVLPYVAGTVTKRK